MEVKILNAATPSIPAIIVSPFAAITPQDAIQLLLHPERQESASHDPAFVNLVASSKAASVIAGDQEAAKLFWQVQSIAQIQLSFEKAFALMKEQKFYDAWCELERCEISVASLRRHFSISTEDAHRIVYIQTMVERWQSLYPYKVFFSPEILKKRVECSTCGSKVSLRNPCGHEKGEIYDGEECHHRVVECELLSMSIVTNPVQKYSVGFLSSEDGFEKKDHYNYAIVQFAIDRLVSPYHGWYKEDQVRRIPIVSFTKISVNSSCPCGSGMDFGCCCASKSEVIVSHCQFVFSVQPSPELPEIQMNI